MVDIKKEAGMSDMLEGGNYRPIRADPGTIGISILEEFLI